jgi:predicted metal-dependent peptidase
MKFLEKAIYSLLKTEPYYAHFILNSRILYNRFKVQTAGATIINGNTTIIFNTKFVESLSNNEVIGLLKHEILHLLLEHIGRGEDLDNHLFNLATDTAINQHIKDIPAGGITLDVLKQITDANLESFQTAEYYYNFIQQKANEMQSQKTTDDHNLDIPDADKDPMQRKVAVVKTSNKAMDSSAGNIPKNLDSILGNLNVQPKINWKQILRNFVAMHTSNKVLNTKKKANRRFDLDFPGKKKKRELILGVCIDSSGSVSDEHYQEFLNEIFHMSKDTNKIYLVHADCEVQDVEIIKKQTDIKFKRSGGGGTAYNPALKECIKRKCNAIIYFGDMDCADIPDNPVIPVLWVTIGSEVRPGNFGKMVKLS